MVRNIVANGKAKIGKLSFEVLCFDHETDYVFCETESDFKKKIVAKFMCLGDATNYAKMLDESPAKPAVVLIRS